MIKNTAFMLNNKHNGRNLFEIEAEVDQYISDVEQVNRKELYAEKLTTTTT